MEINPYLVKQIQLMKDLDGMDIFMGKSELSKTEFRLLREVVVEREQGRDIIASELSRRLGITRSAVSQIISRLEEKNIVRRLPSQTDKKTAYIRLSDHAAGLFAEHCERANRFMARAAEEFGTDRLDDFFSEYGEWLKVCKKIKEEYAQE